MVRIGRECGFVIVLRNAGVPRDLHRRHADVTPWFVSGLHVFTVRSDVRTFHQTWALSSLTSKRYPDYKLNLKFLRVGNAEFSSGDLLVAVCAAILFLVVKRKRKRTK